MAIDQSGTEELLERAGQDDASAFGRLCERHRARLRRLVAARLDRKLAARVDPSDVVHEAFVDAQKRLPEFLRARPVAFFPWVRNLALQRLIGARRYHLWSSKRSALREVSHQLSPFGRLVDRLAGSGTSPSGQMIREEERERVRAAVDTLAPSDRAILDLRYAEDLSFAEIASRIQVGLSAVKMRHLRAIERFRSALEAIGAGTAKR
jgi:RNA polymerase sigma-70 factor (ECF subfamily)